MSIEKPFGVNRATYYMLRIVEQNKHQILSISAYNHKGRDWIFACNANSVFDNMRLCEEGENLSYLGRISPTKSSKHKVVDLTLNSIVESGYNFVIIKIPFTNQPITIHYDIFTSEERIIISNNPFLIFPGVSSLKLVKETTQRAVRYTIKLPEFIYTWQVLEMSLIVTNSTSKTHQAVATIIVPWSNESSSFVLRDARLLEIPLLLHTQQPYGWNSEPISVHLFLDPGCTYTIELKYLYLDILMQVIRVHGKELISYLATISLLAIKYQLEMLATRQHCVMYYSAIILGATPNLFFFITHFSSVIIYFVLSTTGLSNWIPPPDQKFEQYTIMDLLLIPLLLYYIALTIMLLLSIGIYITIIFSGQTINKLVTNFFITRLVGLRSWSRGLIELADKVPFCVAMVTMITVQYSACGGLVLILGTIFYFLKVCSMYEDCLEELWISEFQRFKKIIKQKWNHSSQNKNEIHQTDKAEELIDFNSMSTSLNFHLSLLVLWGISSIVHIPSVLVWAHNYKYDSFLKYDPAFMIGLVMCLVATIIWLLDTPYAGSSMDMYLECSKLITAFVVLVMLYTPVSLYNLPTLLTSSFTVIASHQLYLYYLWKNQHQENVEVVPMLVPIEPDKLLTQQSEDDTDEEKSDVKTSSNEDDSNEESDMSKSEKDSFKNSLSELSLSSSYEGVSLSELGSKNGNSLKKRINYKPQESE
uniref:Uncharacterized protein n=1 Tax=Clastoptera arizonana TaxID=38151 RepID=A0A1B6DWJ1_9HEMI